MKTVLIFYHSLRAQAFHQKTYAHFVYAFRIAFWLMAVKFKCVANIRTTTEKSLHAFARWH